MASYYAERLSAERLRQCYEIAPPRVQQYLNAEIVHVLSRIRATDTVLELGCGYGRVMLKLAARARMVIGIDTSAASVRLARELLSGLPNCWLLRMDALALGFRERVFDFVVCIQNGISAFGVDQGALIAESIRVTRAGGRVLFSSYSEKFWKPRLEWFELQAAHGLVGEIDWDATGDGVIVCQDGFKATTVSPDQFTALASQFNARVHIEEVDEASLFCEIVA
jgi:ubiquinone/menaquinone biosynthesis C-methylase UbiE